MGYATEAEQEAYWAAQGFSLSSVQSFISPSNLFKGNDNLGIAFSATIENIIGSAGADQFTGNSAANVIEGNAGNDTIVGGGGNDYAVFNGNYTDYSITGSYASSYQVVDNNTSDGDDGTDTISGVEFLEFADLTYNTVTGDVTNTSSGVLWVDPHRAPRQQFRLPLHRSPLAVAVAVAVPRRRRRGRRLSPSGTAAAVPQRGWPRHTDSGASTSRPGRGARRLSSF